MILNCDVSELQESNITLLTQQSHQLFIPIKQFTWHTGSAFTRLEPPRFLYVGIHWGQGVWQQPPDYPWPEGSNHRSNKSDPKGGMREGHQKLCPPDQNVPAAPGWPFGAHFLNASETSSFCSTDLKLWRCLLHRFDLMQLKFCVNLNKHFGSYSIFGEGRSFVSPCITSICAFNF